MAQKRPATIMGVALAASAALGIVSAQTANPAASQPQAGATVPAVALAASDLEVARAMLNAGRLRDAQGRFESLVAANYADPDAHFGLGLTLYALGDYTGARFEFQQLVSLAPERYEGYYNLGVVGTRTGKFDEALAGYSKALEVAGDQAPPELKRQLLAALASEQARRADQAGLARTLTESLSLTPDDQSLRLRLADAMVRSGASLDALPLVYQVLQQQPGNAGAALLLAGIYAEQGLTERAVRELDKVVAATPAAADKARLLLAKSNLLAGQHKTREAIDVLHRAAKLDAANGAVQARLGEQLHQANDRAGALAAWRAAVKLQPQNATYRAQLASVQLTAGDYAGAVTSAMQAVQDATDAPTVAAAELVLGVASYRQGKYAQARKALQSVTQKAPSPEAHLWLGLSAFALHDYQAAAAALEASARANPLLETRANLGAALLAAARYPEAEATLRGVVAEAPKHGEAWYNLGWSYRSQGREDEARQAFETALSLGYGKAKGVLN